MPEKKDLKCPKCESIMKLRDSKFGLFYGCSAYPRCDATHGAHPDGTPLGKPADGVTKRDRMKAHAVFDLLWNDNRAPMTRGEAYRWMQDAMGMTSEEAHIGSFSSEGCEKLMGKLKDFWYQVDDLEPNKEGWLSSALEKGEKG